MKFDKKMIISIALALVLAFLAFSGCRSLPSVAQSTPGGINSPDDLYRMAKEDYEENGLKGMWISYLEFMEMDFSDSEAFGSEIEKIFSDCKSMGLNTVIVQVRPFGDAFYKSDIFPFSHIMSGIQGEDPGFDPLEIMVDTAHRTGLRIEAWVNPYRVKAGGQPGELSNDNPATGELTVNIEGDIYYNPALPRTRELVTEGVREIVGNYRVDGIHFDDYFYPGTSPDIDSRQYRSDGEGISLDEYRMEKVSGLVRQVYRRVKEINPDVTFGISPRGNMDNNYASQYSDVKLWMSRPGYVDYIMPQLYWGFDYVTSSGDDRFAYENILSEWASLEKDRSVKLYVGLGAYRIGEGENEDSEWKSGENLSRMINVLKENPKVSGYCLYRYESLFARDEYAELRQKEVSAIARSNRN